MNTETEKMLSTGWNLVRDAGSAVTDAAANSRVGSNLVRSLPRIKEVVSVGAGLALARRGSKAAIAVVRRNPVAVIVGAVALAGVGLALTAAKRRKQAAENGSAGAARPRRLVAKKVAASPRVAAAKTAPRTARARKTKTRAES